MAFRFCDSFDHYVTTQLLRKWTVGAFSSINTSGGRGGLGCCNVGSGGGINKTLDHQATWILGVAFSFNTEPNGATLLGIANNESTIVSCGMLSDHTFAIFFGDANTVVSDRSLSTTFPSYNYIELKVTLSGSSPITATAVLRLNGEIIVSATKSTGINASSLISGDATANGVGMGHAANVFCTISYDDFYACDGTLDSFGHHDFLGDVRIGFVVPNGDVTSGFTKVGGDGVHAYTCVNENPPDDDTSYINAATALTAEEFNWQDISSFSGTVEAVQLSYYSRKDDEGSKSYKMTIAGGTFGDTFYQSDYYRYCINALDSNSGTAWTVANFNSQTFGLEILT